MPIKLTAVSRRRPGLTRAEYFRYIEHYHGTVARLERFKIDRYIQNHVLDGAFGILSDTSHHNKIADRDGQLLALPLTFLPTGAFTLAVWRSRAYRLDCVGRCAEFVGAT